MVKKPSGEGTVAVRKGKRLICQAGAANTIRELEKGLSGRETLGQGEGLLLVFPLEGRLLNGIWMAGMRFAIDVVFIGSDKRIAGIEKGMQPLTPNPRTWRIAFPKKKAKYALEISAGSSKGLEEGDLLEF